MRRFTVTIRVTLLLFIALPLLAGSMAEAVKPPKAANNLLKGTYAFSYFRACVQVPEGEFNADLVQQVTPQLRTSVLAGEITYNGDGTATQEHTFRNMFFTSNQPGQRVPGRSGLAMCDITYQVDPTDRTFEQQLTCTGFSNTSTGGERDFTIEGLKHQGRISQDGKTLLLFDTGVPIETITLVPPLFVGERICTHSGTAVKFQ